MNDLPPSPIHKPGPEPIQKNFVVYNENEQRDVRIRRNATEEFPDGKVEDDWHLKAVSSHPEHGEWAWVENDQEQKKKIPLAELFELNETLELFSSKTAERTLGEMGVAQSVRLELSKADRLVNLSTVAGSLEEIDKQGMPKYDAQDSKTMLYHEITALLRNDSELSDTERQIFRALGNLVGELLMPSEKSDEEKTRYFELAQEINSKVKNLRAENI